jgi:hypothetical protein
MATDTVKVAVRVRPQSDRELDAGNKVVTAASSDSQIIVNGKRHSAYDYAFSQNITQAELYNSCVKNLVSGVFNGLNGTILAYGQVRFTLKTKTRLFRLAAAKHTLWALPSLIHLNLPESSHVL